MTNYSYIGSELELFRAAKNWKNYYYHMIRRHLGSEILEVGAGIGGTTKVLCRQSYKRWLCLEPDAELIQRFKADSEIPTLCEVRQGILADLPVDQRFDAILYIDVLEHIEADQAEVQRATAYLKPGGVLIVLAPAHQWLFSPFDKSIGHYRRYNKAMLSQLTTSDLTVVSLKYLDSVGLLASLSNRWLKQRMPTPRQIKLWDTWMVPISKVLDPMLQYTIGKSILGVWCKN
ncbi:class I SAM-dependent methyltransferase [Nodosilinea sp. LEGE 06152]|uniref:class I SAM-dependent methyltransferase n=1 Tax=Nodosilinea sp. LEGE 06152 TaxID=2777966 RepID=UPI00187ED417|nr:class I SAM-dependent methyltransferase [Nodosilinea sp. LEGE 06152]MBE9156523.1 class I SAM-dependent methyltransferase [Nodosilinea sp. LEGE 06152]